MDHMGKNHAGPHAQVHMSHLFCGTMMCVWGFLHCLRSHNSPPRMTLLTPKKSRRLSWDLGLHPHPQSPWITLYSSQSHAARRLQKQALRVPKTSTKKTLPKDGLLSVMITSHQCTIGIKECTDSKALNKEHFFKKIEECFINNIIVLFLFLTK